MPGLMVDLPGPGKLRAAGDAVAAESRVAYFEFEREILRTALAVKTAYYQLHFLEETLRVERETLQLLADLEQLAQQQSAAGRVTLQDVLRAQIARDQVETQIVNLEDSRSALVARLKSALGLGPGDADPPIPAAFEPSAGDPQPDQLLATALSQNPGLRAMEEDVRRAEAALALARKSGVPDLGLGLEVDLEADPTIFRPSAWMTLPIWRDKLAAEIAGAQASKRAAEARLSAEQVEIAAELAALLFMLREAVRNDALLADRLVPKARQSLDAARAGYVNGRAGFLDVIDAQRTLLAFELMGIEARTRRELALASLSLAIAGVPPSGAPTLAGGPSRSVTDRFDGLGFDGRGGPPMSTKSIALALAIVAAAGGGYLLGASRRPSATASGCHAGRAGRAAGPHLLDAPAGASRPARQRARSARCRWSPPPPPRPARRPMLAALRPRPGDGERGDHAGDPARARPGSCARSARSSTTSRRWPPSRRASTATPSGCSSTSPASRSRPETTWRRSTAPTCSSPSRSS